MRCQAAILLFLLQVGTQPVSQQETTAGKASIEGIVLRSESGEPLARAEVKLARIQSEGEGGSKFDAGDASGLPSVLTESDGRFLLKSLEPGQYALEVLRNGYAPQTYGQKRANTSGRTINLLPGEVLKNIVLRMIPAATITGRVRDSVGEPLVGLEVGAMRIGYSGDQKVVWNVESARTDDRGEYRLFWIEPGRYYLRVSRGGEFRPRRDVMRDPSIVPTYYPGTFDIASAVAIELQPGSELGAVDIVLPKSTGHWIRGRIVDSSTGKPPNRANLELLPNRPNSVAYNGDGQAAVTDYDATTGVFSIRNVVPGRYFLSANAGVNFDSPIPQDRLAEVRTGVDLFESVIGAVGAAAWMAVDMPAADLNDVVVTLAQGISIPVRLRIEASDLSAIKDMDKIRVALVPKIVGSIYRISTRLSMEGAARIENVLPGEYTVSVDYPRAMDLYVKEILYGRDNVLSEPIRITDQQPGVLTILLSTRGGRIEGSLIDALSQPLSGAEVVLVPDQREKTSLFQTATTDHDGHFVFRALAPGGYKVFSWESLESNAYYDNEVLSKYETQGRPVQIQESSKVSVDLKIIPETRQ